MDDKKKFLFLGASCDDCEWMAGGLAKLLVKEGHHVTFASGQIHSKDRADEWRRLAEEAWDIIGVTEKIIMPHHPLRRPEGVSDEELARMIGEVVARVKPYACFIQPPDDYMEHHMRFARASFLALEGVGPAGVPEVYAMECPAACGIRRRDGPRQERPCDDASRPHTYAMRIRRGFQDHLGGGAPDLLPSRSARRQVRHETILQGFWAACLQRLISRTSR